MDADRKPLSGGSRRATSLDSPERGVLAVKIRFLPVALVLALGCQTAGPVPDATAPAPAATPAPAETAPAAAPAPTEVAPTSDLSPSTMDGIYTPAQAERGVKVWENVCSECHDPVDWTETAFRERWNEDSVYRFWYYIYERMPEGSVPYSLPRQDVTDVLTYILQLNGVPAGDTELGSDDDSIGEHWLVWGTPGDR